MKRHTTWLVLTLLAVSLAAGVARADVADIDGDFTSVGVLAPECTSFLCTRGTLTGGLAGTYFFTMTTLAPDPDRPGTFVYSGNSSITTATGTLFGQDTGWMNFATGNPAPFVTTVHVVSGTGAWAGATGTIVATGSLDFTINTATGTYTGSISTP